MRRFRPPTPDELPGLRWWLALTVLVTGLLASTMVPSGPGFLLVAAAGLGCSWALRRRPQGVHRRRD